MQLNKYELQTLKKLNFYKVISIGCMCFSAFGVFFGLYARFFRYHTKSEIFLNNALIGASLVVLGISYLMYHFLKIIEKLNKNIENLEPNHST
jgi:uncharacterized membrane protein